MTTISIHVPDGCCAEPDPIRIMLEKIMASLDDLTAKITVQGETIAALRTYVTGIETAVRNLSSGEVLSATVQAKVDAIVAAIDANQVGLMAAGDGDIAT
jgi:hypothetical protein